MQAHEHEHAFHDAHRYRANFAEVAAGSSSAGNRDPAMAALESRFAADAAAAANRRQRNARAKRAAKRLKGYEGDACGSCGNFTLLRNGTCLKYDNAEAPAARS
jgi:ribonucleoside-diphosphate reductase alpha chain